jgi:hypothetical protein
MIAKSRAAEQVARRWFAATTVLAAKPSSGAAVSDIAPGAKKPYEVWMFNGLRLRHVPAGDAIAVQRFEVRRGDDATQGQPVVVEFTEDVTSAAAIEAGRSLDRDQAFWIRQAALALGQYVWNNAETPAEGRLLVTRMSHDLAAAARQKR